MAFKMKSGNTSSFKNMGSSPAKQKVDPDAPGTLGKPGYEPPVKRSDLDTKGKAIWDAHRAKAKEQKEQDKWNQELDKAREGNRKKKSPAKAKGDNLKRIMSEKKVAAKKAGTWYKPGADPAGKTKTGQRKYVKYNAAGERVNMMGVKHGTPKSELTNIGSLKKPVKPVKPSTSNFNFTGSKASTTPGYSTTKAAKKVKAFKEFDKWHKTLKKSPSVISNYAKKASKLPKNFNIKGSSKAGKFAKVTKKVLSTNLKSAGKQALGKIATGTLKKGVSRAIGGPVGLVAGMAYGAYKSGQKHSGGKIDPKQKSIMTEGKKKTKSIFNKKK